MNKGVEFVIIWGLFSGAMGYLVWRGWEALRPTADTGCAKGCGCAKPTPKPE